MKLNELILRRPLFVAFGTSQQTGGLTSVDLEATRDASQVVLSASDGSVAPVVGADATTAGVMTAADKAALEALPPTTTREFAARADITQATVAAAITHLRSAGYSGAGDGGGALYVRVATQPVHALKVQSADGAWWELVAENGWINVLQAGADPSGAADSIQAFRDCADFARYNTSDEQGGGANGPAIHVPQGKYLWSDTFEPRAAITMVGFSRNIDGNAGTIIEVAADKDGIILPHLDTIGAATESPDDTSTDGANGSVITGIQLKSAGGIDNTKHGVRVRTAAIRLEHVECRSFPGDGFHIVASVGSGGATQGVANHWSMINCSAIGNQRNGLYVSGGDANAGYSLGFNGVDNGRWCIWDEAFLGNVHIAAHSQGCGGQNAANNATEGVTAYVSHNNERYMVVPGQEAAASTTEPGTNSGVWFHMESGGATGVFKAWSNGGTYVAGGSWFMDVGPSECVGCYSEDNNASAIKGSSRLLGGTNTFVLSMVDGDIYGTRIRGSAFELGGLNVQASQKDAKDPERVEVMPANDPDAFLRFHWANGPGSGVGHRFDGVGKKLRAFGTTGNGSWPFELLTDLATDDFGRGFGNGPGQGNVMFPNGLFVGFNNNARHIFYDNAAPTSGRHARGDVVLNRDPSVQTDTDGIDWIMHGWQCTAVGTPGTWKAMWVRVSNPPGL